MERFWSKVEKQDDGCWIWLASKNACGYGIFGRPGRRGGMALAHRFCWEMLVGPIPKGLETDHLCRVRECVNPGHLELVTHAENIRRGRNAQREQTHCKRGHEFTKENTYNYGGKRHCRTCRAGHLAAWRERQRLVTADD